MNIQRFDPNYNNVQTMSHENGVAIDGRVRWRIPRQRRFVRRSGCLADPGNRPSAGYTI